MESSDISKETTPTAMDAVGELESAIANLKQSRGERGAARRYTLETAAQEARDALSYIPALLAECDKEEQEGGE